MSHLPRVPVRFIPENQELLKSTASEMKPASGSNYQANMVGAYEAEMEPSYRRAPDRVNGNEAFRRYPDGTLDYEYAMHKVVDAIHKKRDGVVLTSLEQAILSCCFPSVFDFLDPGVVASVRMVNLKLSPAESLKIAQLVSEHLYKELEYMLSCHAR